ncbi:MAG: hypothetical protein ABI882_17820 [Acidobacteriota bacterium]
MATTEATLEAQYDAVVKYIRGYLEYVLSVIDRSALKRTGAGRTRLKLNIDPFNLPDSVQAAVAKVATPEEKSHEFYDAMVSRDQAAAFSVDLIKRFPGVKFDQLVRFSALKQPNISMFDSSHLSGLAFGLMGGVFQFMPRLLIEYPLLDIVGLGFYLAAMAIIYPRWTRHGIERKEHLHEKYILTYTSIVQG